MFFREKYIQLLKRFLYLHFERIIFGNDIDVGPLVVLTALSGGKLSKLILKFNFLLISRALAQFDAETFQRRVNCYIVSKYNAGESIGH